MVFVLPAIAFANGGRRFENIAIDRRLNAVIRYGSPEEIAEMKAVIAEQTTSSRRD